MAPIESQTSDIIIPFIGPIIAATSLVLASVGLISRNQNARITGQDTKIEAVEDDLQGYKKHSFDTYMPRKEHEVGHKALEDKIDVLSTSVQACTEAINVMNSRSRAGD